MQEDDEVFNDARNAQTIQNPLHLQVIPPWDAHLRPGDQS
jgi:hypothetical protein